MSKLKSRKFWVTVATAGYFAAMAIKEQGAGEMSAKIVYAVCIAAVIVGYLVIEGFLDDENRIENEGDEKE